MWSILLSDNHFKQIQYKVMSISSSGGVVLKYCKNSNSSVQAKSTAAFIGKQERTFENKKKTFFGASTTLYLSNFVGPNVMAASTRSHTFPIEKLFTIVLLPLS